MTKRKELILWNKDSLVDLQTKCETQAWKDF